MDLRTRRPRSPYETVGGIRFLPRTIDKMRAHVSGTAGGYRVHVGASRRIFRLFGISSGTFEEIVKANQTDEEILAALMALKNLTPADRDRFNNSLYMRFACWLLRNDCDPS
jgi:hypothetical protein